MIAEKNLFDIYFIIRKNAGWLAYCHEAGYSKDEMEYLEKLDDEFGSYQPEKEADNWAREVMKGGGPDVFFAETDDDKIRLLCSQIDNDVLEIGRLMKAGESWPIINVTLKKSLDSKIAMRDKVRARQIHTKYPDAMQVTEYQITFARRYPLAKLLGRKESDRIPCPFHGGENNNFSLKNGWGYCFKCGESCDSIKWLMTQKGMKFKDAVLELQN